MDPTEIAWAAEGVARGRAWHERLVLRAAEAREAREAHEAWRQQCLAQYARMTSAEAAASQEEWTRKCKSEEEWTLGLQGAADQIRIDTLRAALRAAGYTVRAQHAYRRAYYDVTAPGGAVGTGRCTASLGQWAHLTAIERAAHRAGYRA